MLAQSRLLTMRKLSFSESVLLNQSGGNTAGGDKTREILKNVYTLSLCHVASGTTGG